MKTIAIVGAGYRCYHNFATNLHAYFSDKVKFVGICDPNFKRGEYYRKTIDPEIRLYRDFDKMLAECKPDAVLVTTVDRYHHEYIVRALRAGFDVYSEKPLTIDEEKCLAIRQAEKESGKRVIVTFNCRFMPYIVRVKELLNRGVIGRPLTVNYEYTLNRVHGGDYFKRWHRFMENCGGMLVHKSTHHFDIVNWLLEDDPVSVCAMGSRLYYGREDRPHGERCSTCEYKETCDSYEDLSQDTEVQELYFRAESEDGYQRDHCVFQKDTDIYDAMSVSVSYEKGAILTYSLNLFSTREGYRISITGEKGRIEAEDYFIEENPEPYNVIKVLRFDGSSEQYTFPKPKGTHAGADLPMLSMLFGDAPDKLGQCSDSFDGVKSAMIGIAANRSIREGRRIDVKEILEKMK